MDVGFIGLGIMGKPMAKNVLKKGHTLYIYDCVDTAYAEMKELGAVVCQSPYDMALKAKIIITMLPNTKDVLNVVNGDNGLLKAFGSEHVLIDMSSISPAGTLEIFDLLSKEKNAKMLDAPVSGGEAKAIDGTLSIMVGGSEETFNEYKELLSCMGASIVRVGEIAAGNVAKLVNQMIVASTLASVSEAMKLARLYGVSETVLRDAVKGGMAGSAIMENKLPQMIAQNFKPGFKADLQIKDLTNAVEASEKVNFAPKLAQSALAMLKELSTAGFGGMDHSILYKYYDLKNKNI